MTFNIIPLDWLQLWNRLLRGKDDAPRNMHIWWPLYDKYQEDMDKLKGDENVSSLIDVFPKCEMMCDSPTGTGTLVSGFKKCREKVVENVQASPSLMSNTN